MFRYFRKSQSHPRSRSRHLGRLMVIVGILASAGAMVGCQRHGDPAAFVDRGVEKLTRRYDLTETQVQKLTALANNIKVTIEKIKTSRSETSEVLRTELRKDQMDTAAVSQQLQNTVSIVSEAIPSIVEGFAEFRNSLNPEQRNEMLAKLEKFWKSRE
jgi:Spy/CpxP family protein refolding chaperone